MSITKTRGATPEEDEALGFIQRGKIERVDPPYEYNGKPSCSVTMEDGFGCAVRNYDDPPKVGDILTTYGRGFGYSFHGQALNGRILWYDSIDQEEANRAADSAEYEAKRRREFADNLAQMDADFDALPPAFKARIVRNRAADPEYRWGSMGERYEVFTCQQAVILADWARAKTKTIEQACEAIDAWNLINSKENDPPYDFKAQGAAVPGWSDQHSGNTHGFAVMLAKAWLMGKDL